MKKTIVLLLLCLSVTSLFAIEKGNGGVRASFDVSIPGNWNIQGGHIKMFKPGCGFSVGCVYYQPLGKGLFLEPGLTLFYDTYSFDDLRITGIDGTIATKDPGVRKAGLRLPVQLGYEFRITEKWRLAVYTGPELSYVFSQNAHVKHRELLDEDFSPDLLGIKEHRRFDCAWKAGIAVPIDFIWVGIDAALGLTDLLPGNVTFRENRVSVNATYYF